MWNIVSVPYKVDDYAKTHLFPTANGNAFLYDNGYYPQDTLENGRGYWLKFPSAQTIVMDGTQLDAETVDVAAGWNMVGSLSSRIDVADVGSSPGGIVTSAFYRYDGSYTQSPVIDPGRGYWVKAAVPGQLLFTAGGSLPATARIRIDDRGETPPAPPEPSDQQAEPHPLKYTLEQNTPNPFNPSTQIRYTLPLGGRVSLVVYDLLGRRVAVLVEGVREAGEHLVRWEGEGLPGGVYFYRLVAPGFSKTMKMVMIR